jgi:predicted transcriptional regulator
MRPGVRPFGELEAAIMRVVWEHGAPIPVRAIVDRLNEQRDVAYTTVITVAERLREKGMLTRVRRGRAFLYEACLSADDYSAELMRQVLNTAESRSATLLRFAGQLSAQEAASLRAALADSPGQDVPQKAE